MNIKDLVEVAKKSSKQLADLPDAKARALVRAVFAEVVKQVEKGGDEPVRIGGLGLFRTREVQKEGQAAVTKRTIFRAAGKK
jgi:nucleoid DNA-binding protein